MIKHFNSKRLTTLQKQKKVWLLTLPLLAIYLLVFSSLSLAIPNYDQVSKGFREILKTTPLFFTTANSGLSLPTVVPNRGLELKNTYVESQEHFSLDLDNGNDPSYLEGNDEINPCYLYEDQDINALLRLRSEEVGLDLNLNILMPPLEDNLEQLEVQFREERERYLARVSNGETLRPRNILLPLNITRLNHWIGVVIRLDEHNQVVQVDYVDSLSYSCRKDSEYSKRVKEVLQRLNVALKRAYGNSISISIRNLQGLLQTDNVGCGPLTVENLILASQGLLNGENIVDQEEMREIRAHHVALADAYVPALNLRARQRENICSFNYKTATSNLIAVMCGGGNTSSKVSKSTNANNVSISTNSTKGSKGDGDDAQNIDFATILPDELILKIFENLDPKELSKVAIVSKEWRRNADDDVLWWSKIAAKFTNETVVEAVAIDKTVLGENDETYSICEQNARYIYRICELLRFLRREDIITILSAEKGEIIYLEFGNKKICCEGEGEGEGAQAIATVLKNPNNKVTVLDFSSSNQIGDDDVKVLAEALKNPNCKVTELNFWDNKIGAAGTEALTEALKNPNCKVTILYLSWNKIGDAGAEALARALKDPNCKVTELELRSNQIGAAGTGALAEALKDPNCKVTKLNLSFNRIGAAGAEALARALKDPNCKVTNLDLTTGNKIGDAGAEALARALKDPNCKVTKLNLSFNLIGAAGAEALARALKDPNCKVTNLDLTGNKIGDAGAEALAEAVDSLPNHRYIHIRWDYDYLLMLARERFKQ